MSKAKNSAAPKAAGTSNVAGTIAASVNAAIKLASAVVKHYSERKEAEAVVGRIQSRQIVVWSDALKGVAPVNTASWNASWKDAAKRTLLASGDYEEKSVGIILNRLQKFTIARTNDYAVEPGDTVETYLKRHEPALKATGAYVPANKGGNPDNKAKAAAVKDDKGQIVSRDLALLVLSNGDKAHAAMLDFLTRNHMDKLVALAATLMPLTK